MQVTHGSAPDHGTYENQVEKRICELGSKFLCVLFVICSHITVCRKIIEVQKPVSYLFNLCILIWKIADA